MLFRSNEKEVPFDFLKAYILYDDSAVRVEELKLGFHKSATLIIDPDDVALYAREFDQMRRLSRPLEEYFPGEIEGTAGTSPSSQVAITSPS